MDTPKYTVTLNACSQNDCAPIYYSPHKTLKSAMEKFDRIVRGDENYGQLLYDPHEVGVMLSLFKGGLKIRTMQLN